MRIVRYPDVAPGEWDRAVDSSADAWLMHRAAWVDIETAFFVERNLSFALLDAGRIVAVQPLYLSTARQGTSSGENLVHSGIHRHAGLALAADLAKPEARAAQKVAMGEVRRIARAIGADRIQLSVQNLAPRSRSAQRDHVPVWVSDHGFQLGIGFGPNGLEPAPGYATLAADQIVELDQDEADLWASLDEACRRAVRKAEKSGLTFEASQDGADLERYWALACRSAERTGEALPDKGYYETIVRNFMPGGRALLCFARHAGRDVGALFLLIDKGAASYLGGVSEPEALALRPNDFVHWRAILACRARGLSAYRFGPIFPEVPSAWPISRVSAFKGKFGGRSVPTNAASLFMDARLAHEAVARVAAHMAESGVLRSDDARPAPSSAAEFVAHHLRVVGIDASAAHEERQGAVLVADGADEAGWIAARAAAAAGRPAVVLRAAAAIANLAGGRAESLGRVDEALLLKGGQRDLRAKSLHEVQALFADKAETVAATALGAPAWIWVSVGASGLLLLGTDLARDLTRLRQGDPVAAANRPAEAQWGIAGERPMYLFDAQLDPAVPHDRPADWWIWAAREALIGHGRVPARDVLPFGAKGMVIVTGDDDQAPLEDYQGQKEQLGLVPITYFLHPLTKHDAASMARQGQDATVEWELHPDALETPDEYGLRLDEQCAWFETLTGKPARLVRNHGYLNDGYWGHATPWLSHGIIGSSNLPGVDGRVLNGSLLPARLMLEGKVTRHWSQLTAFGDGAFFILEWNADTAMEALLSYGQAIVQSGVPGIIVLNLHPANQVKAAAMHEAAHRLVGELGFAAATFGAALDWFGARDTGIADPPVDGIVAPCAATRLQPDQPAEPVLPEQQEPAPQPGFMARLRRFTGRASA